MATTQLPHAHGQAPEHTIRSIPASSQFQVVAELFKQLSDGNRIRIFWLLCHCEACVVNLSAMMQMSCPAVCHHLKQLKKAGLIVCRREGKEVYYRAADTSTAQTLHHMVEQMVRIACPDAEEKKAGAAHEV